MKLRNDLYFAQIDARGVLLDLESDRYIGLSPNLSEALATELGWSAGRRDDAVDARDALRDRGILVEGCADSPPRWPEPPSQSVWPSENRRASLTQPLGLGGAWSVLRTLHATSWMLKHRSFRSFVGWIAARPSGPTRSGRPREQQLIDSFAAARPFFPDDVVCRLDAPALCVLLRQHGHRPKLVFGVRLDPFVAHCWAQDEERVFGDSVQRIRQFTPILAV